MYLDRRYKYFNTKGDDYAQESEKDKSLRLQKYTLFKLGKQKLVWKNFLRAMMSSFQMIMMTCMLNMKLGSTEKPYLTISTCIAWSVFTIMLYVTGTIGYQLYLIDPKNFKTEK